MTRLEEAYRLNNEEGMAAKVSDEADAIVEQIEHEIFPARALLASLAKVKSRAVPLLIWKYHTGEKRNKGQKWKLKVYCCIFT